MFDRKRTRYGIEEAPYNTTKDVEDEEKSCRIEKVENGFTVHSNGAIRVYLTFNSAIEDLRTYLV